MANTYTSLHFHVVFSTKGREPWLTDIVRGRVWPYLGGIARDNGITAIEIGGVSDHVHLLISTRASMPVAKAVQLLKGGSSHWIKDTFRPLSGFGWQDGYGAFSVSRSQLDTVQGYIRGQPEHHRTKTFGEEYVSLLRRHRVEFDERYLFD